MISREELDRAFDSRFDVGIRDRLHEARVAIAGLGGLGSHIASMLARSGIEHLLLVDFDVVDVTNLNRQLYTVRHIGMLKTEALKDILLDINPYLDITTLNVRVTAENVNEIFGSFPIVCEAFDQADQKAMLVNSLLLKCPSCTVVSGNGMAGYRDANTIQTRKLFSRLYVCGDGNTDVEEGTGLMAPRVSVCAGHQANKVIQLILEEQQFSEPEK